MPSNVLVSGIDEYAGYNVNGLIPYVGASNARPLYEKVLLDATLQIQWIDSYWLIGLSGDDLFTSSEDVAFPWLVTSWTAANATGTPVLTEMSVQESIAKVSGAGTVAANGLYTYRGMNGGKPYYNLIGTSDNVVANSIYWDADSWFISDENGYNFYYLSTDPVLGPTYPWISSVYTWENSTGVLPLPLVEEVKTFGLPINTVTLLTQSFGSVERYLRLRNLGQV